MKKTVSARDILSEHLRGEYIMLQGYCQWLRIKPANDAQTFT